MSTPYGGAENQTASLMEGLRARKHEIGFLGSCPALLKRTEELRIKNYELRIGPPPVTKWGAVSFLWRRKKMQGMLIEAIEKLKTQNSKPQAVFMLSLSEKLLLTDWAAESGIKVFWIEHDRIGSWLKRNPWLSLLRRVSKKATVICVSELSKKLYEGLGFDSEKIVVIPNGVSSSPFSSSSRPEAQGSQLRLGCIARLSPEKGVDVLLQAIQPMAEFSLTIVGSGPEEGFIRRMINEDTERIGTDLPRIRLESLLPDLESFYASIDVLVLPSAEHDPFGLVAAEAMMRGIPVIVTDKTGIADYLKSGEDALIVKAGDADSLRLALKSVSDPAVLKCLSDAGRATAGRVFSLAKMVDHYEQLLKGS